MARVNPIIAVGCGVSADLSAALSSVDNLITDILNGIGDITGAIADAVSSALDAVGVALGKMLPDLSGLIPSINFSAGIESLLGLVEGSLEYAAKLAELILDFGEAILGAGLNIFDMIADAAGALLKGLNPCGALKKDFSKAADGSVLSKVVAAQYPQGLEQVTEITAPKPLINKITKPKQIKYDIDIGITLADDIVITPEDILEALDEVDSNLDSLGKAINDNVYGN